jgi:serralysin
MAIATTGINHIDSLMLGYDWGGTTGVARNVTYALSTDSDSVIAPWMESAVEAAMQKWANVANVTFTQNAFSTTAYTADIDILRYDLNASLGKGVLGVTYPTHSGSSYTYAQVAIDDLFKKAADVAPGKVGFMTILHELGHALGLNHPGNYGQGETGPFLPTDEDTVHATVMSYYQKVGKALSISMQAPTGPMIYDIAAMQYMYGANTSYNAGTTTYSIARGSKDIYAIWDGGGAHDLIDASQQSKAIIDLREGLDYYSTFGKSMIWNAFGANIEDATGSGGSDRITGNDLVNILVGNKGNDSIAGGVGGDTLYGDDTGGVLKGNDSIHGDDGNDSIFGGQGSDKLYGDTGNDLLYGDDTGGLIKANDTVDGGDGDDTIHSGGGADKVYGGAGNDLLYAEETGGAVANDTVYGGDGNDTIYAGGGSDKLYGEAGNDLIYGNGTGAAIDKADTIEGGAGNDTIYGGGGADLFIFNGAGTGTDVIMDFEGSGVKGGDVIQLHGFGFHKTADILSHITYAGTDASIDLGGGNIVLVHGVNTHFISSDFKL